MMVYADHSQRYQLLASVTTTCGDERLFNSCLYRKERRSGLTCYNTSVATGSFRNTSPCGSGSGLQAPEDFHDVYLTCTFWWKSVLPAGGLLDTSELDLQEWPVEDHAVVPLHQSHADLQRRTIENCHCNLHLWRRRSVSQSAILILILIRAFPIYCLGQIQKDVRASVNCNTKICEAVEKMLQPCLIPRLVCLQSKPEGGMKEAEHE